MFLQTFPLICPLLYDEGRILVTAAADSTIYPFTTRFGKNNIDVRRYKTDHVM